ncbi:MAG TPA: hypothetical protein VKT27_12185 [Candidatus Binataceae bacterium]|nr:hypothetical protein [Candidatus Binataceae bacterium]
MKRIASTLIGALFLGAGFGIAMAQGGAAPAPAAPAPAAPAASAPAAPAPAEAATANQEEVDAFHRMLKMHHRMWRRLKQNPNVVTNDAWVGKYPDLQLFFNKYQGSKERFLAQPGVYLNMKESKALHREETRGAGGE